jgi:AcrR family transcriptional regulator
MGYWYFQLPGDPYQIGQRCRPHLLHDSAAMNLKCNFTDAELCGSLLVEQAADHQRQHFAFARGEIRKALLQLGEFCPLQAQGIILTDGRMDCPYQLRLAEWFDQKIDGAALHCPHRRRNVAMSGDKYDRWVIAIGNLLLKFQAVDIRQFHVQNQAGRKVGPRKVAVLGSRSKCENAQTQRRQEFAQRVAHVVVVIHDEDDLLFRNHCDVLEKGERERRSAGLAMVLTQTGYEIYLTISQLAFGPMSQKPRQPKLNPRKQATQARAAKTIEIILEAAAHILERDGFAGYTTNAIAKRAGVSIGSLYQYFPNKDAVTIALIDRESAGLIADLVNAASDPDWRGALAAMARAGVTYQFHRPELARLLDLEDNRLPNPSRQRLVDVVHSAIVSVLERAQLASHHTSAVVAFDVIAITRGIIDAACARGEMDADAVQGRVMQAILGYLDAREAS